MLWSSCSIPSIFSWSATGILLFLFLFYLVLTGVVLESILFLELLILVILVIPLSTRVLSTWFIFSLAFLLHLFLFLFRLVPKISGWDLLLVERVVTPRDRRAGVFHLFAAVAMSFACVLHFAMSSSAFHPHVFKTCIPLGSLGSLCCPFWVQSYSLAPAAPLRSCFVSRRKTFSEWAGSWRLVLVHHW